MDIFIAPSSDLQLQYPPTPVPLPPPAELPFTVPEPDFWDGTDQILITWQMIPSEFVLLFQAIVVLLLIGIGISIIRRYLRRITNKYQVVE